MRTSGIWQRRRSRRGPPELGSRPSVLRRQAAHQDLAVSLLQLRIRLEAVGFFVHGVFFSRNRSFLRRKNASTGEFPTECGKNMRAA